MAEDRETVVDADGHVCEPPDLWTAGLPAKHRERALRLRWNEATGYDEAWVEDWCITDRGLVDVDAFAFTDVFVNELPRHPG